MKGRVLAVAVMVSSLTGLACGDGDGGVDGDVDVGAAALCADRVACGWDETQAECVEAFRCKATMMASGVAPVLFECWDRRSASSCTPAADECLLEAGDVVEQDQARDAYVEECERLRGDECEEGYVGYWCAWARIIDAERLPAMQACLAAPCEQQATCVGEASGLAECGSAPPPPTFVDGGV